MSSPYETARDQGYSDEEIFGYLEKHPKYSDKISKARDEGYSDEEIGNFLSSYQPKQSKLKKAGRVAAQYGIGAAEAAAFPYQIAGEIAQGAPSGGIVGTLAEKGILGPVGMIANKAANKAQEVNYRENLLGDIERLQDQKLTGVWDEQDQNLYDNLIEQVKNPEKAAQFVGKESLDIRHLAEKATGQDLHPKGVLEKAANWTGFLRKPQAFKELIKLGTNPKELIKAVMPGTNVARGLGAGTALEMAEDNQFGPLGTMAAAVIGDVVGGGAKGIIKAALSPKKTLAKGAVLLASSKNAIKNDLKEAAAETKFTKDIGTLTDSNIVKMVQARLTASGLTGKSLENLRKQMTKEIVGEYESIANTLGESRFQSIHEAGEAVQKGLKEIRDADLAATRKLYQSAENSLKERAFTESRPLANAVEKLEKQLQTGSVRAPEQQKALSALKELKQDIYDSSGNLMYADVRQLMANKRSLKELIDYEVQGGAKQNLKKIVQELDNSIVAHGKENKKFAREYIEANKKFAEHAKTYRNRNIDQLLRSQEPTQVINKMATVQGIRDLRKALSNTPEGKNTFNELARKKLDLMIGDKMTNNITEQLKTGTFANLLEKGKNKELVKELLSPEAYKNLVDLQAHAGKIAESAKKFFNASQSATAGADMAIVAGLFGSLFSAMTGNPWAIASIIASGGGLIAANRLAALIADPKFLKMVEEGIKISQKNNVKLMNQFAQKVVSYVQQSIPGVLKQGMEDSQSSE